MLDIGVAGVGAIGVGMAGVSAGGRAAVWVEVKVDADGVGKFGICKVLITCGTTGWGELYLDGMSWGTKP